MPSDAGEVGKCCFVSMLELSPATKGCLSVRLTRGLYRSCR